MLPTKKDARGGSNATDVDALGESGVTREEDRHRVSVRPEEDESPKKEGRRSHARSDGRSTSLVHGDGSSRHTHDPRAD